MNGRVGTGTNGNRLDRELRQSLSLILMTAAGVCAYLGLGLLAVRVFG